MKTFSKRTASCGLMSILIGLLIVFPTSSCSDRRPPLRQAIVIVLDSARPDHFSSYGYSKPTTPEIDRLAARGSVFLNNYAQATTTQTSLPSLLYSRYFAPEMFPNHHTIPFTNPGDLFRKIDDEAISLPRALEARGIVTAGISAHEWISSQSSFAREFAFFFDLQSTIRFDPKYPYPRADKVVDQAIDWISKNRSRDFFLYLHVMDTHFPHFFEGDARSFFGLEPYTGGAFGPEGLTRDVNRSATAEDRRYLNALYDGGLRYADRELGRLFGALNQWGALDHTLIVITSDHGEFLLDRNGHMTHGGPWYEPLARVPLIIYYPQKVPVGRREVLTESIDLAPTLLNLLGIPIPEGRSFDGRDLFQTQEKPSRALAQEGIRDERYKLVFKSSGTGTLGQAPQDPKTTNVELYDLAADPEEMRDLAVASPTVVKRLLQEYRARLQPRWDRFQAATTHDQPRASFAISAPALGGDATIPYLPVEENPANLLRTPSPSGWLGRASWDNSWLFAKPAAKTLHISFPMPKGKYFLVADIWGAAEFEINGQTFLLKADVSPADLRRASKPIDIGEVELKTETFSAIVRPRSTSPWFAIRYLGFNPVINGSRGGYYDKEREQRLRALGYIR